VTLLPIKEESLEIGGQTQDVHMETAKDTGVLADGKGDMGAQAVAVEQAKEGAFNQWRQAAPEDDAEEVADIIGGLKLE
jgi:hypothetical protein